MLYHEQGCIITSLNLYEFSQVNNNEMGIYIDRSEDSQMYSDAFEEAQRIIRISDEVRITLEKVAPGASSQKEEYKAKGDLISYSKVAKRINLSTDEFMDALLKRGYIEKQGDNTFLTELGKSIGGEHIQKSRFGPYFKWPSNFDSSLLSATDE